MGVHCGPLHRGLDTASDEGAGVEDGGKEGAETLIAEEERKKGTVVGVGDDLENQLVC